MLDKARAPHTQCCKETRNENRHTYSTTCDEDEDERWCGTRLVYVAVLMVTGQAYGEDETEPSMKQGPTVAGSVGDDRRGSTC
jgi:hypothetical protein